MYFPNLHGTYFCLSLSKALTEVSLKYAFKLMQDLITSPLSSNLLSTSLASFVIIYNLPLPSTLSHCLTESTLTPLSKHTQTHTSTTGAHTFLSPSAVLGLIYSACLEALIKYLRLWSSLKGRNRRRATEGFFCSLQIFRTLLFYTTPSVPLLFCLSLPPPHPSRVCVTPVALSLSPLAAFMFSFHGSSIMCCRQRL